jgi:hypothetical protein
MCLLICTGCSGLLGRKSAKKTLPKNSIQSAELDAELPAVAKAFQASKMGTARLLWLANTDQNWRYVRHSTSRHVLRRQAVFNYVFQKENGRCYWDDAVFRQPHVAANTFGAFTFEGLINRISTPEGRLYGDRIECAAVENAKVGHTVAAPASAPPSK